MIDISGYSPRIASAALTDAACLAGSSTATSETSPSATTPAAMAGRSCGVTPKSTARRTLPAIEHERDSRDDTGRDQRPGTRDHQADEIARRGAERHADPELTFPLRHEEREDAVKPERGQEQRRAREASEQARIESRLLQRIRPRPPPRS